MTDRDWTELDKRGLKIRLLHLSGTAPGALPNLTSRRGDLLAEATTLHQRFPYAVIGALFLFAEGAAEDGTSRRPSTFETAHEYFRTFDGRGNQANSVERFEALGIVLYQEPEEDEQ